MYKDRIRHITPNSHPQFFIRRPEIAFDERLPFIESVLETLIESRFGPGGVYHSGLRSSVPSETGATAFYDLCDRPGLESAPLFDLFDDGETVPFHALSLLGRAAHQVVDAAFRTENQMGFLASASHRSSLTSDWSSNLGRGSP